ncbi:MAG: AEC family transporter [Rhodobacteraceae bacterium]|nr:AEC family transporter [Paracoccaceae bacterium]
MQALLGVILPVFLVIGFGYLVARRGWFGDAAVDGLMQFTQQFAIPCLLFAALARLDLARGFDLALIASFYGAATLCFIAGLLGARLLFGRPWEDAVAIGFVCLFSNSVLLGLPIMERAYGAGALEGNFAIIALHAPYCYALGLAAMETVRARGALAGLPQRIARAVFRNGLVLAIAAGLTVNLTGLPLPGVVWDALDLMIRAALPAALFGLGGILCRYRPEGDLRTIAYVCAVSLVLHPALVWIFGRGLGLSEAGFRSAVVTAAMAPGVNGYVFASLYGVARRVAASAVLIATAASVVTAWLWLTLLGGGP